MIAAENLSKSYGGQVLFDGVSFQINPGERVGLVGRNGHGKTTLFRIISGEALADSGTVTLPKNYRIGYVKQALSFTEDTILAEGMTGLVESERDARWKVEKVLTGLGFSEADFYRSPADFSGGYQVRLNLVKALVSEPDLLMLDEPTNYLDITSIRWIVSFLQRWPRELLLITHDRGFMDQVVSHTMGIHRRQVRKMAGDTDKYYDQIAQEEEVYEKTRLNDERRRREVQQFITRFRAKARLANLVQSRIKTLSKMEKREKLDTIQTLEFSFRSCPSPAKRVMSVENLRFAYPGGPTLVRDFSLTVQPGERIGVVGKNGRGKTTLLKLLAGKLHPLGGKLDYHPKVRAGFFEQTNVSELVDSRTVEDEILYAHADVDRQTARNICGAMMFSGDDALKKIGVLSGGEKSRVMLGKVLVTPVNLLLLDEPSNHLDMDSTDALLAALDDFDGAVIMVTHNEMFLHALAQRLVVFQNGEVFVFDGSYQRFLEKIGWQEEESRRTPSEAEPAEASEPAARLSKKEVRKRRSEIVAEKSEVLRPMQRRVQELEAQIEKHEKELVALNEAMVVASQQGDGARIGELSRSLHVCQSSVDRLYDELEQLSDRLDENTERFDRRLGELETQLS
ncbi:MAG: ATP-binding cassette domain-containing protein [Desulfobacteraceae bacterium]|nr:ATP-binding cassette domain-containing protein [Desulfobacteraceae bacterium]